MSGLKKVTLVLALVTVALFSFSLMGNAAEVEIHRVVIAQQGHGVEVVTDNNAVFGLYLGKLLLAYEHDLDKYSFTTGVIVTPNGVGGEGYVSVPVLISNYPLDLRAGFVVLKDLKPKVNFGLAYGF